MNIGFYAGSFDPFSLGHLDVALRAAGVLDRLYIGVGINPRKAGGLFPPSTRIELIQATLNWHLRTTPSDRLARLMERIEVTLYSTLVFDAAEAVGATYLVRGVRAVDDFNEEWRLKGNIEKNAPHLDMLHFFANKDHLFDASSMVQELASFGASRDRLLAYVAPPVADALVEKFAS